MQDDDQSEDLSKATPLTEKEMAAIPARFRRLQSPRQYATRPDSAIKRRDAQLAVLPVAYVERFEHHITDLRTVLDPDVWAKVQHCTRPTSLYFFQ